mgnify:CR=1 FL=1
MEAEEGGGNTYFQAAFRAGYNRMVLYDTKAKEWIWPDVLKAQECYNEKKYGHKILFSKLKIGNQLNDDEKTDTGANVGGLSVHAGQHVDDGLTHCDHHAKQLLCTVEQGSVLGSVSNL